MAAPRLRPERYVVWCGEPRYRQVPGAVRGMGDHTPDQLYRPFIEGATLATQLISNRAWKQRYSRDLNLVS